MEPRLTADDEAAIGLIAAEIQRPRSHSHDIRHSWHRAAAAAAVVVVALSWAGILAAISQTDWLNLNATIGFHNQGEEHVFDLGVGLWRVYYDHQTLTRFNRVSSVRVAATIDAACDTAALTDCGAIFAARRRALASALFGCAAAAAVLPLRNLFRSDRFSIAMLAMAALSVLMAALASNAAHAARDVCIIDDPQASSRLVDEGTSVADLACDRITLGLSSYLLIMAVSLHGGALLALRSLLRRAPPDRFPPCCRPP
ncbi:hypothetical protein CTAYLR_001895 [Chrysophaeum taylorii]|uniref:Uncharacterized protein n=1 Tax=Chrysophaeum taylorii TaxID=2483200 RepID=A0AAD7U8C1_9STRA|nr:hypothetical protein CTAYLR_001895 [Chrysophaeum taylorii]